MATPKHASDTRSVEAAEKVAEKLFYTAEGRSDPYPLYHELRETNPAHRTRRGMRYDDCWATMRDPRLGKDYAHQIEQRSGPDWHQHPALTAGEHSMLNVSGPERWRSSRSATVTAMTHMITHAISRERLRSLVDDNPAVREWMVAEMRRRYSNLGTG